MQGFILHTQKVKDEDLIVYILSTNRLLKSYRFYGLRHSSILNGYKIDFALEEGSFLPRLKDVLHLGFLWINERDKMFLWQEFIRLLFAHLRGVDELEGFYFKLLDDCAKKLLKQNPKRVIIDAYVQILEFEGRLHKEAICFACDEKIHNEITLLRAFLPAHSACALGHSFDKEKLKNFYESKNSSVFEDEEIEKIYLLIKEGL